MEQLVLVFVVRLCLISDQKSRAKLGYQEENVVKMANVFQTEYNNLMIMYKCITLLLMT